MENPKAGISAEHFSQQNDPKSGGLQYLHMPLSNLKGRLKQYVDSSASLEYLDEIKDLLNALNDLEHRFYALQHELKEDSRKSATAAQKSKLESISKEIHLLQIAIGSLIQSEIL